MKNILKKKKNLKKENFIEKVQLGFFTEFDSIFEDYIYRFDEEDFAMFMHYNLIYRYPNNFREAVGWFIAKGKSLNDLLESDTFRNLVKAITKLKKREKFLQIIIGLFMTGKMDNIQALAEIQVFKDLMLSIFSQVLKNDQKDGN